MKGTYFVKFITKATFCSVSLYSFVQQQKNWKTGKVNSKNVKRIANVSAGIGPALAQCWCAIWVDTDNTGLGPPLYLLSVWRLIYLALVQLCDKCETPLWLTCNDLETTAITQGHKQGSLSPFKQRLQLRQYFRKGHSRKIANIIPKAQFQILYDGLWPRL